MARHEPAAPAGRASAERLDARQVRALRPARPEPEPDPRRPLGIVLEDEPLPGGGVGPALTVFLAGAECPFSCVFCDLWRYTLSVPTPPGALPAQLDIALDELAGRGVALADTLVKLYNASNFFDDRAVPPADRRRLLERLRGARGVTVECHPRLLRERDLADAVDWLGDPRRFEVAVGLETAHPGALEALGKEASRDDFRRAAGRLRAIGVSLRVFLLLGAPFVEPREQVVWLRRSIDFAVELGAAVISLIPVRGGNGALDVLARRGHFDPPTLASVAELCAAACDALSAPVPLLLLDPWDLEELAGPEEERTPEDRDRLAVLEQLAAGPLNGAAGVAPP